MESLRKIGKVVGAVVTVIGLAGIPADLATWARWLSWLRNLNSDAVRTLLVAVGLVLFLLSSDVHRRLGRHPPAVTPSVEKLQIRVPAVPNRAAEDYVEWLHIEVEPTGEFPEARNARAWAMIGNERFELRWATDAGPQEERTLRYGRPDYLPLVIRSRRDAESHGNRLARGLCYLTDNQFLVHRNARRLHAGDYRINVTVAFNQTDTASKTVWIEVPDSVLGELRIRGEQPPIEDRWVDLRYVEDAGIAQRLRDQGFGFGWVAANDEQRKIDLEGWEVFVDTLSDGRRVQYKVRDHPVVGGYLVLMRKRES